MISIHRFHWKNDNITFCCLDLHLIECMQTFSGMIVAAPKRFLIPRSLDPSLISALHCALHCFHIKCNVSKTQYTSQCRDLIAKGCKRTRKYYFAALSVQCFGAMPDQRWVSRYPDGTGWLDTSPPPLYNLTLGLTVQRSIPTLITLVWGLCASDLRSRGRRRPKKEIGFPPRNLQLIWENSFLNSYIIVWKCRLTVFFMYFPFSFCPCFPFFIDFNFNLIYLSKVT